MVGKGLNGTFVEHRKLTVRVVAALKVTTLDVFHCIYNRAREYYGMELHNSYNIIITHVKI